MRPAGHTASCPDLQLAATADIPAHSFSPHKHSPSPSPWQSHRNIIIVEAKIFIGNRNHGLYVNVAEALIADYLLIADEVAHVLRKNGENATFFQLRSSTNE